jgi:hypothetical protein
MPNKQLVTPKHELEHILATRCVTCLINAACTQSDKPAISALTQADSDARSITRKRNYNFIKEGREHSNERESGRVGWPGKGAKGMRGFDRES